MKLRQSVHGPCTHELWNAEHNSAIAYSVAGYASLFFFGVDLVGLWQLTQTRGVLASDFRTGLWPNCEAAVQHHNSNEFVFTSLKPSESLLIALNSEQTLLNPTPTLAAPPCISSQRETATTMGNMNSQVTVLVVIIAAGAAVLIGYASTRYFFGREPQQVSGDAGNDLTQAVYMREVRLRNTELIAATNGYGRRDLVS